MVSYRVISADGHPVRGGSVFGVGDVEVDAGALGRVAGDSGDRAWEVVGAIGRGLAYAGVLVAAGGTAFLVLVHRGGAERARLVRLVRGAAVVGGLASLVALPVQAALGTGQGAGSLFDDGVLAEVAKDGVGLGVRPRPGRAGASPPSRSTACPRWPSPAPRVAAASFATNGHTRAGSNVALATAADVSHLWVVAVWGGGLVLLWPRAPRPARRGRPHRHDRDGRAVLQRGDRVDRAGGRDRWACSAWNEVRTVDALTSTGYGRLLLVKVAPRRCGSPRSAPTTTSAWCPPSRRGKANAALTQLWTHAPAGGA